MTPTIRRLRARKLAIAAMPYTPTQRRATPPANRHNMKPVICLTTNQRFACVLDAADWLSNHLGEPCSSSAVSGAIRRRRIYKGFWFKYEADGVAEK